MGIQANKVAAPSSAKLDRTSLLLWIAVSAMVSVLIGIVKMSFMAATSGSDADTSWPLYKIVLTLLGIPLLIPVLQWLVLRRVVAKLKLLTWYFTVVVSWIMFVVTLSFMDRSKLDLAFSKTLFQLEALPSIHFWDVLSLPWLTLFAYVLILTIASSLLPSLILDSRSNRAWYYFLVAAIAGALAAALVEQTYAIAGWYKLQDDHSLWGWGWGWQQRVGVLAFKAGIGGIAGTVSGITYMYLSERVDFKKAVDRQTWLGLVFLPVVLSILMLAPPLINYLSQPQGVRNLYGFLRKTFSLAPGKDQFSGDRIISYSHQVEPKPYFPYLIFAPDSQSFLTLDEERQLVQIATVNGQQIRKLAEPLGKYESYDVAWSGDGRYFALRTQGDEIKFKGSHYSSYSSRIRLYSLPDYVVRADYNTRQESCFDTDNRSSMAFAQGSSSLWILCGNPNSNDQAGKILALNLTVPTLRPISSQNYSAARGYRDAHQLQQTERGVFAIQIRSLPDKDVSLLFTSLSPNPVQLETTGLEQPHLAGKLTPQFTGLYKDKFEFHFCGNSSQVADPIAQEIKPQVHGFCRTLVFDFATGKYLSKRDELKPQDDFERRDLLSPDRGLQVKARWREFEKNGELDIADHDTKQAQKIKGLAQHPLEFSPDKHWLITYAVNEKRFRVYKVK